MEIRNRPILKAEGEEAGWTQKEVSEKLGVSDGNTISRSEKGLRRASTVALNGLAGNEKPMEWFEVDSGVGEIDEGRGIYAAIGVGQSGSCISELFALGPQRVPVVGTVSAGGIVEGWGETSDIPGHLRVVAESPEC